MFKLVVVVVVAATKAFRSLTSTRCTSRKRLVTQFDVHSDRKILNQDQKIGLVYVSERIIFEINSNLNV